MSMEELKKQLGQQSEQKQLLVQQVASTLLQSAESLKSELRESAANFRADLRDTLKQAQEDGRDDTKLHAAELRRIEQESRQAAAAELTQLRTQLATTHRRLILWAPLAALAVMALTAGGTVGLTWWLTDRGTLNTLTAAQTTSAEKLAEIRTELAQTKTALSQARTSVDQAKHELQTLQEQTAAERARYAEAQRQQSRLTTFPTKDGKRLFVQVPAAAKPVEWEGRTIIEAWESQLAQAIQQP